MGSMRLQPGPGYSPFQDELESSAEPSSNALIELESRKQTRHRRLVCTVLASFVAVVACTGLFMTAFAHSKSAEAFPEHPAIEMRTAADTCTPNDEGLRSCSKAYVDCGYTGCQTQTISGKTCQRWDCWQTGSCTHSGGTMDTIKANFTTIMPFLGVGKHNYCRNPDNGSAGVWCYTTDPSVRWDWCDPKPPMDQCTPSDEQVKGCPNARATGCGYTGCQSKTRTGRTCQRWDCWKRGNCIHTGGTMDVIAKNWATSMPARGVGPHNFCRIPDDSQTPWCYTTDPNKRWEECSRIGDTTSLNSCSGNDEQYYGCSLGYPGCGYTGCQTKTRSGKTCQRWDCWKTGTCVHTGGTMDLVIREWDNNMRLVNVGGHNYCRNPDGEETIWCYTTDPDTRWDYCNPKPYSKCTTGKIGTLPAAAAAQSSPRQGWSSKISPPSDKLQPCWMSKLPNGTLITRVSIPATHDTMTYGYSGSGFETDDILPDIFKVQTQTFSLRTQLDAGIRCIDIRARNKEDILASPSNSEFYLFHGGMPLDKKFSRDVRDVLHSFLDDNPSEFVIMKLQCESGASLLTLGKEWKAENCDKFLDILKTLIGSQTNRWIINPVVENIVVGEVRGKIIALYEHKLGREFFSGSHTPWTVGFNEIATVKSHVRNFLNTKVQRNDLPGFHGVYFSSSSLNLMVHPFNVAAGSSGLLSYHGANMVAFEFSGGFMGVCTFDFPGEDVIAHVIKQQGDAPLVWNRNSDNCRLDGALCSPGSSCNDCCNPADNAAVFCGGGVCWSKNTYCLAGTTCDFCCNGYSWRYNFFDSMVDGSLFTGDLLEVDGNYCD